MIRTNEIKIEWFTDEVLERFWRKVDILGNDECWEWTGRLKENGRGNFNIVLKTKHTLHAHRVSWVIHFGEIQDGLFVLHTCDRGSCVNPKHLFLGTQQDNIDDMNSKGRAIVRHGEDDPKSKLTEQNVRDIRRLYTPRGEFSQFKLAKMFGVTRSGILQVLRRATWKHVE